MIAVKLSCAEEQFPQNATSDGRLICEIPLALDI